MALSLAGRCYIAERAIAAANVNTSVCPKSPGFLVRRPKLSGYSHSIRYWYSIRARRTDLRTAYHWFWYEYAFRDYLRTQLCRFASVPGPIGPRSRLIGLRGSLSTGHGRATMAQLGFRIRPVPPRCAPRYPQSGTTPRARSPAPSSSLPAPDERAQSP